MGDILGGASGIIFLSLGSAKVLDGTFDSFSFVLGLYGTHNTLVGHDFSIDGSILGLPLTLMGAIHVALGGVKVDLLRYIPLPLLFISHVTCVLVPPLSVVCNASIRLAKVHGEGVSFTSRMLKKGSILGYSQS